MFAKTIEKPQLAIVGIGAGDAELITLRGIQAIQKANVIFYDESVPLEILQFASGASKVINLHSGNLGNGIAQEEINRQIAFYTHLYGIAVRLKQGDPFTDQYGDGETEYAYQSGIHVQIVPGISNVLTTCPIALTKRGINESFLVITGEIVLNELLLAARSTATVVVKRIDQLDKILTIFREARPAYEPAVIMQYAIGQHSKSILGNLSNLDTLAKDHQPHPRSILIIGKTVQEVIDNAGLQRQLTTSM